MRRVNSIIRAHLFSREKSYTEVTYDKGRFYGQGSVCLGALGQKSKIVAYIHADRHTHTCNSHATFNANKILKDCRGRDSNKNTNYA